MSREMLFGYKRSFVTIKFQQFVIVAVAALALGWLFRYENSAESPHPLVYVAILFFVAAFVINAIQLARSWPKRILTPKVRPSRKTQKAPPRQDDLTQIPGIGSKIEELLRQHQIHTFGDLATTEVVTLRQILEEADDSFRLHEAENWPIAAESILRKKA